METLSIREAVKEDSHNISVVHVRTWQEAYKGIIPDSYLNSLSVEGRTQKWIEMFDKPSPNQKIWVAQKDDKIVGFSVIGTSRDENATPETGELFSVYVDPDHMRQGIGAALMRKAIEGLKEAGFTKATLWTLEDNTNTRKFYEAMGWTFDGTKKTEVKKGVELKQVRYSINLL